MLARDSWLGVPIGILSFPLLTGVDSFGHGARHLGNLLEAPCNSKAALEPTGAEAPKPSAVGNKDSVLEEPLFGSLAQSESTF